MKKKILTAFLFGVFTLCLILLAACGGGNSQGGNPNGNNPTPPDDGKVAVTWYDATGTTDVSQMSKLKEERVEKGTTLTEYTPEKEGGYEFMKWYATPTKSVEFDFTKIINEDTSVFAGFTKQQEDTREFYILGSGTSELLFTSNWGKVITDDHKLTKASGKNEYSITCDLKQGDEFQFALNSDWANKRGFGYLATLDLPDGTAAFSGQGSVYDDSAKGSNIKCEYSGNYTLTLKTYPNEDYYNTSGTGYTEERKEIYNLGLYDTITWVRNGDVINDSVTVTDFYIKGEKITGWADMYNADTKMINNGGTYTLTVYLKEGDQFMFTSQVTKIETGGQTSSVGSEYIKSNALTAESRTLVNGYTEAGGNMTAVASGMYTFTYDGTAKTLAVTFKDETPAAQDYYLDGNFDGHKYGDFMTDTGLKLTETASGSGVYAVKNVKLTADSELLLRAYAAGEKADWDHTHKDYQYSNLAANSAFEAASATNNNIKVKTEGVYDISFDSYSKIITITVHTDSADTLDLWIKGTGAGLTWDPNFQEKFRMTLSADGESYEYTITVTDSVEFGIAKYAKGSHEGYGEYINVSKLGTAGDANDKFKEDTNNIKCITPGTYKVVYNIAAGTVDIYEVQE